MRVIDSQGRALIQQFEGLRLEAYQDVGGIWTIGYGHTGPDVKPGMVISQSQAEALFDHDITWAENCVSDMVTVPLANNQFAALVSLVYNIGQTLFYHSTLLKLLNNGDYNGAGNQFLVWDEAVVNGVKVVVPGLETRRKLELQLWLTPDEDDDQLQKLFSSTESVTPAAPKRKSVIRTKTMMGVIMAFGGKALDYVVSLDFFSAAGQVNGFSDINPLVHKAAFVLTIAGLATAAYGRIQLRRQQGV